MSSRVVAGGTSGLISNTFGTRMMPATRRSLTAELCLHPLSLAGALHRLALHRTEVLEDGPDLLPIGPRSIERALVERRQDMLLKHGGLQLFLRTGHRGIACGAAAAIRYDAGLLGRDRGDDGLALEHRRPACILHFQCDPPRRGPDAPDLDLPA